MPAHERAQRMHPTRMTGCYTNGEHGTTPIHDRGVQDG